MQVDWLALQLTWQRTNICVMDAFTINFNLAFLIISTIFINVINLIQFDYDII